MALKPLRIEYISKNFITGLTDVTAQVYVNNVAKAVGVSALALTEVDAVHSPGLYELVISAATLAGWGIPTGSSDYVTGTINSAGHSAEAPFKELVTVYNPDDLAAKIGSPVNGSLALDIAAVKSDTGAIKTDLETGPNNLANIYTAIQAIQNNAGFAAPVPCTLIKPGTGANGYRVPLSIYNENNALVDPDSQSIIVTCVNQSGADRSAYLVGASGGSVTATRDSLGQYHFDLSIPSTASQEELIFAMSYAIGGAPTSRRQVSEIITDVTASGFALETTSQLIKSDTTTILSDLVGMTSTLGTIEGDVAAVKADVENVTYGLSAIEAETALIKSQTDKIADGTIGLAALRTGLDEIKGAGFVNNDDSLHELSVYLKSNLYSGGYAV